jgi:hypothetical protein
MFADHVIYRGHAIQRMFERRITEADVRHVLMHGDVIEPYPNDLPYPSRLILGEINDSWLHVLAAYNEPDDETIVITVYHPDPKLWSSDFRIRRKP